MIVVVSRDLPRIKAAITELGTGQKQLAGVRRRVQSVVAPIERAVDEMALSILPHGGGLNRWVADAPLKASIRTGARSAGVRLRMGRNSLKKRSDLNSIDRGEVRHPTYGRRGGKVRKALPQTGGFGRHFAIEERKNDWHDQAVEPGFFTIPAKTVGLTEIRRVTEDAIADALRALGLD